MGKGSRADGWPGKACRALHTPNQPSARVLARLMTVDDGGVEGATSHLFRSSTDRCRKRFCHISTRLRIPRHILFVLEQCCIHESDYV